MQSSEIFSLLLLQPKVLYVDLSDTNQNTIRYDAPCVSKLFTNPFSYLVPTHVLYLALVLVLPTVTLISVFDRGGNLNINSLLISFTVVMYHFLPRYQFTAAM